MNSSKVSNRYSPIEAEDFPVVRGFPPPLGEKKFRAGDAAPMK